jgi:hypothetical protein
MWNKRLSLADIKPEEIKQPLATLIGGETRLLSAMRLIDLILKSVFLFCGLLVTPSRCPSELDHHGNHRNTHEEAV